MTGIGADNVYFNLQMDGWERELDRGRLSDLAGNDIHQQLTLIQGRLNQMVVTVIQSDTEKYLFNSLINTFNRISRLFDKIKALQTNRLLQAP